MGKLVLMFVAGGVGCLARYGMGLWLQRPANEFPLATLLINLIGCFLFGLVWVLGEERGLLSSETRILLLTGFMGSFTTFSTFAFESHALVRSGQLLHAFTNILLHVIVGLVAVGLGMIAARSL